MDPKNYYPFPDRVSVQRLKTLVMQLVEEYLDLRSGGTITGQPTSEEHEKDVGEESTSLDRKARTNHSEA